MKDEKEIDEFIVGGTLDVVQLAANPVALPLGLVAAGMGALARSWRRRKIDEARDIFVSEVRKGYKDLLDIENPDEFIPMWYRYMRAAVHGRARMNLRLMAKVMLGHAISPSLFAEDFLEFADLIESLRREEIIYLATMIQLTRTGIRLPSSNKPDELYGLEQSVAIKLRKSLSGTLFFEDEDALNSCQLGVLRTGLLRHDAFLASGTNIYAPSKLLFRLAELADFEDVLSEEGVNFTLQP